LANPGSRGKMAIKTVCETVQYREMAMKGLSKVQHWLH